jgi:transcriptional regulator with XRE-family HTH domain
MRIAFDPGAVNFLGPALRRARTRSRDKLTQEQLAARLQVFGLDLDRTAISRIESQKRAISDIELFCILKALRIDLQRLFEIFHQPIKGLVNYRQIDLVDDPIELVADPVPPRKSRQPSVPRVP